MFKAVLPATFFLTLGACSDPCTNTIVSRLSSPDGQRDAVLFQRDCGATTGFSTQVSILDVGAKLTGAGNTFRADDNHDAARVGDWGGSWAEMKWLSSNHLLVRYAAKSRIFEQDDSTSGVAVSYQSVG